MTYYAHIEESCRILKTKLARLQADYTALFDLSSKYPTSSEMYLHLLGKGQKMLMVETILQEEIAEVEAELYLFKNYPYLTRSE